jgi:hypothetical protein
MSRGIYITANDKVADHAIALLNSIRAYDAETPVVLIPYDENYHEVANILKSRFNVTVYKDLEFIDRLSKRLHSTFGDKFFARPNQFRKQACWFGEFDEFLYIDTDIVVFEKIIDNLDHFDKYDFLSCDYQHRGGIKNVFSQTVINENIFNPDELKDIFNGGWWASKKGLISEQDIYETFAECAAHPQYFDFTQKTSDQPIINYMILKRIEKRFNLVNLDDQVPGSWAGSTHFIREGNVLFDPSSDRPLQYLHWAGVRIEPGCAYWDIWAHYRYLGETIPIFEPPAPKKNADSKIKQLMKLIKN